MIPVPLTLAHPALLALLALLAPAVVLIPRRRLRASPLLARRAVLATRVCLLAAVVVALAEPELRVAGDQRAVVFALDVSDSMTPGQQAWARHWVDSAIRALPAGSRWSVEQFAARPELVADGGGVPPPGAATDVAAALSLGDALLTPVQDGRASPDLVLLTDGWDTMGHPVTAGGLRPGVAVSYVVPPAGEDTPQAVIRGISLPAAVRVGETPDLTVQVEAAAPAAARLRVTMDGATLSDGEVQLQEGSHDIPFAPRVDTPGFHEVAAALTVNGRTSRLSSVTIASDAGRVLVLEDEAGRADALASLLARSGVSVERRPAKTVPPSAAGLADFDAVVLVDTPATSLALDQLRTLQSYARDLGRGVVVVGGPRSFGPGGYEGTALDDMLPVSAQPPVAPQQGSLALFLVVDRSGSMQMGVGGTSKIAMARTAASRAAELLKPNDTLGVIAFDTAFDWVVPPVKVRGPDDVRQAQALVQTIEAGGGTTILPPLRAAMEAAAGTDAALKHVVLLTDGESADKGYEELLARMAPRRVTLSTVAIGSDADRTLLASLARLGGGRSYFTERSTQIPQIATKETTILTRNAVVEGQAAARVGEPSPLVRALSGAFPVLSGYVATTRKERAVTALETERGDPLLAHWQYGLGRVVAWTSEADQGWGAAWADWPGAAPFWSQVTRWAMPAPQGSDLSGPQVGAQVLPDGRRVTIRAHSVRADGTFADLLDTRATILAPDGTAREVQLPQQAPGTYELTTTVAQPGAYRVMVAQRDASGIAHQQLAGFAVPDSAELHTLGTNRAVLQRLAAQTGGRELAQPEDLVAGRPGGPDGATEGRVPLWQWPLVVALLLLPLDVYLRRRV